MGSYFHVIERKVGGNLDAFRRELGRLRESGHFHRDRHERIMRIAQTVGFGHIVRQCLVDTGHRAGCEVHVLTSTGIVLVFNAHSCKLVTVLVARPGQVARYYEPFGEDVPDWLMARAYENTCVRHARRCTSKMVASSSTRWQEGHPRGCPSLMESLCGILYYHFCSIVGCYN